MTTRAPAIAHPLALMDKPLSQQGVAASRPMPSKASAPYSFYLGGECASGEMARWAWGESDYIRSATGLATALAGTITHPLDLVSQF